MPVLTNPYKKVLAPPNQGVPGVQSPADAYKPPGTTTAAPTTPTPTAAPVTQPGTAPTTTSPYAGALGVPGATKDPKDVWDSRIGSGPIDPMGGLSPTNPIPGYNPPAVGVPDYGVKAQAGAVDPISGLPIQPPNAPKITMRDNTPVPIMSSTYDPMENIKASLPTPQQQYEANKPQIETYKPPAYEYTLREDPKPQMETQVYRPPASETTLHEDPPVTQPAPSPYKVSNAVAGVDGKVSNAVAGVDGKVTNAVAGVNNAVSNNVAGVGDVASFDKGPMTDLGTKYHDSLMQDLTTADNPYVRSIRESADRQSDKNSYGAQRSAEEALGAAGIQAGTSQYSRALAKASGTANEANLNLRNNAAGVQRDFYQNALKGAGAYENDMFGRAKGERDTALEVAKYGDGRSDLERDRAMETAKYGDTRSDLERNNALEVAKYGDTRGDLERNNALEVAKYGDTRSDKQHGEDEATRLEGKGDALAYINSIEDPKARAAARLEYEKGGSSTAIGDTIFDQYGAVKDPYKSASPGSVEAKGMQDRVRAALTGQINPKTGAMYTEPEIQARASELAMAGLENEVRPLTDGTKKAEVDLIVEKVRGLPAGQFLTQADFEKASAGGALPRYSAANIAMDGSQVSAFLKNNPGGLINLDGKQYRVIEGSSPTTGRSEWLNQPRHTNVTKLEGPDGVVYAYNGAIHTQPPSTAPGDFDFFPG